MPKIYLKTLESIPTLFNIDPKEFERKFPIISQLAQLNQINISESYKETLLIDISNEQKEWIDRLCVNISYQQCSHCKQAICGTGSYSSRCSCDSNKLRDTFQQDYKVLYQEIQRAEKALEDLQDVPFRQLRNAIGTGGWVLSLLTNGYVLINLVAGFALATGAVVGITVAPALLAIAANYAFGYMFEKKANHKAQAKLMSKKIELICKHRDFVTKRYQNSPNFVTNLNATDSITNQKGFLKKEGPYGREPISEDRLIWGNPLAHFGGATAATLGLLVFLIIKFSLLAVLGGPLTIALVVGASLAVGFYFGYNRHKNLVARMKFEKKMAILDARKNEISALSPNANVPINSLQAMHKSVEDKHIVNGLNKTTTSILAGDSKDQLTNSPLLIEDDDESLHEEQVAPTPPASTITNTNPALTLEKALSSYFNRGVQSYLNPPPDKHGMPRDQQSHLHWTSRFFDSNRGLIRANIYKTLIANSISLFEKQVVAYSLFASEDGKTLQKQVYKKMGYVSLEEARIDLWRIIRSEIQDTDSLKLLRQFVVNPIASNANSNKSVESGAYNAAFDMLNKLRHPSGISSLIMQK